MKKLELAWEAVQDIYTTHANIYAYRYGLNPFCSFGERTYLIKISKKKIQAFYDSSETNLAAQNGLKDFLNPKWRKIFKNKAQTAIERAKHYTKNNHLRSNDLTKEKLFELIKKGTEINNELFVAFAACQPQYTSLVEKYIKDQMPVSLTPEVKDQIFLTLTQSDKLTSLNEEEIAWQKIIKQAREKPELNSDWLTPALEKHAQEYGLLHAADGLPAWTKESLLIKLENARPDIVDIQRIEKIRTEKENIIREYEVDNNVIELCNEIAELGHLRLCLRVEGWAPVSYILMQELFQQLPRYLPYTARRLECTVPEELSKIFDGDYSLDKGELDRRYDLIFYGLLDGEEVRWSGDEAQEMIKKLVPSIDTSVKEVKGQVGWKGKVTGRCFVLHWDSDDAVKEIEAMPEGAILVAGQTRPQLMTAIKRASAIVTDEGGLLSHAAIVSRELSKPSVIGTKFATKIFKTGDLVEVDANKGIVRIVEK